MFSTHSAFLDTSAYGRSSAPEVTFAARAFIQRIGPGKQRYEANDEGREGRGRMIGKGTSRREISDSGSSSRSIGERAGQREPKPPIGEGRPAAG